MKARTTLLLLAVAAAAFFFIRLYDQNNLSTRDAEAQEAEVFAKFDRDKLTAIEIETGDENIELKKENGVWNLDVPVHDRADMGVVTRLLTSLETLSSKAKIEKASKDKIKEFGLNKPAIRVRFDGEDIPSKFSIGDDTAASGGRTFYARVADRDTVYVIEGDVKQQLSQTASDFRDRRLMTQRPADATRMVIHLKSGDLEVRNESDEWSLVKPYKARGDTQKIRDLIASLTNARIEDFATSGQAGEDDGLTEPAGSVDLYFDGTEEPETIKFGRSPAEKPDAVYVALSSRIGVFEVAQAVSAVLGQQPNDLRDRNLVRVNPDIVDRITITPAHGEPAQLARRGEEWVLRGAEDRPANGPEILRFIEMLRNYKVQDFVAETASDLQKYGLAQPEVQVSFSSYASQNTAESAAGENLITTVRLARPADAPVAYAHLEEEPFVLSVDPGLLEKIPTSSAQWRSPVVTDLDPAAFASIGLRRTGREPVNFTQKQDTWAGAGIDPVAIQSLANTLAKLRAVRWIGDTAPDQGLADPAFEVAFTIEEESRTLLIGNETPDRMHFAQFQGDTGVFLMSDPDFKTVLAAQPGETPAASAAPSPDREEE